MRIYAVIAAHAGSSPFRMKRCLETVDAFSTGMGFTVEPIIVRWDTASTGPIVGSAEFASVSTLFALRDALRDFIDESYVLFLDPHSLYPDNYAQAHAIALSGQPSVPGSTYTHELMLTKTGYAPGDPLRSSLFACCLRTVDARAYVADKFMHCLNTGPATLDRPAPLVPVGDAKYPVLVYEHGTESEENGTITGTKLHPYWAHFRQWIVGDVGV